MIETNKQVMCLQTQLAQRDFVEKALREKVLFNRKTIKLMVVGGKKMKWTKNN